MITPALITGLDTVNPLELRASQAFSKVLALLPGGRWLPAKFSKSSDTIAIQAGADTMLHLAFKLEKSRLAWRDERFDLPLRHPIASSPRIL